ncbi:MAG: CHAP domain-containing protein [Chloroflexi bacterium]|nr:MAG: CHAP domain-containing protein [Chloroflexota bacterium]
MRWSSRRGLIAAAATICAALVLSAAASAASPTGLAAQRAELVQRLAAIEGPRADARHDLLATEQQLAVTQRRLLEARRHLAALDAKLLDLSRHIADNEHVLSSARRELAALLRSTYEVSGDDGFAGAILSAESFNEAMDRIRGAQHVTDQVQRLSRAVRTSEEALLSERNDLRDQFAHAEQLESQLGKDTNRMVVLVAQRTAALRDLDGPARVIAKQIADLDQQLAGPPSLLRGGCGNHFAYGQCTYYVASRRCIPWFGNAWEWWHNAAVMGYAEGHQPRVGAIAVWGRRGHGASGVGHVALVEEVGPTADVPVEHFKVSEMNHSGWNRVNYRIVENDAVLGFIYFSER